MAKAGYVEVPSRSYESCDGVERAGQAGLSHHRWLIEIRDNRLRFLQKYHMIHTDRRFHLPRSYRHHLTPETSVQWLWWKGSCECEEVEIHGIVAQEAELERFVQATCPYPGWERRLREGSRWLTRLPGRAAGRVRRLSRGE